MNTKSHDRGLCGSGGVQSPPRWLGLFRATTDTGTAHRSLAAGSSPNRLSGRRPQRKLTAVVVSEAAVDAKQDHRLQRLIGALNLHPRRIFRPFSIASSSAGSKARSPCFKARIVAELSQLPLGRTLERSAERHRSIDQLVLVRICEDHADPLHHISQRIRVVFFFTSAE